ncbi:uncharacterized protein LOC141613502 [Silene latifolia]|uniref:uncharacterized protein LOC141613502 n=1 Tax=Silene latifolia TaxID=37657 RepID=UPI003D78AE2E
MFQSMLDRIRSKIANWANGYLSYVGKVALINSVIFGIQNFWGASVLLPKGIVKSINKICKDFLWGVGDGQRRMVFKSWLSFCCPRKEGGVDIKEVLSWNKCLLLSWLRKIELDSPTIWVKWINAYVLKGVSVWDFQITAAYSWGWRSIISCRDQLVQATGSVSTAKLLICHTDYKLQAYDLFRVKRSPAAHCGALTDPLIYPKHAIISLLALQDKLSTTDNLCKRGFSIVSRCSLCQSAAETSSHLFFTCAYSAEVWLRVAHWLRIGANLHLIHIVGWLKHCNRGKSLLKRQRRCALACSIYLLWQERNRRIFACKEVPAEVLFRKLKFLVLVRFSSH